MKLLHRYIGKKGKNALKKKGTIGVVWINGFNLGRYWSAGPTETLYVPAPVLKNGVNEIVIFEQEKLSSLSISFSKEHDLGAMEIYERHA